jgi:TonB-dependent SusC/RagA subfamily outer membrane receptor
VPETGAELPAAAPAATAPVPIPNLCEARSGGTVVIRGVNPLAVEPLLVVDGVVQGTLERGANPFSTIPSGDIESITILKTNTAAAEYGAKPGQGVLLVRTRKSTSSQP